MWQKVQKPINGDSIRSIKPLNRFVYDSDTVSIGKFYAEELCKKKREKKKKEKDKKKRTSRCC